MSELVAHLLSCDVEYVLSGYRPVTSYYGGQHDSDMSYDQTYKGSLRGPVSSLIPHPKYSNYVR